VQQSMGHLASSGAGEKAVFDSGALADSGALTDSGAAAP
jgi:hypothetical protein